MDNLFVPCMVVIRKKKFGGRLPEIVELQPSTVVVVIMVRFGHTCNSVAVGFLVFENWSSKSFVLSLSDLKWSKWVGEFCSCSNLCCCWCECNWHNRLEFASTRDDLWVLKPDLSPCSSPSSLKNINFDWLKKFEILIIYFTQYKIIKISF